MDERTTLRYIDELQGQIDQLKNIIKGGGGGGGSVVINPEGAATADLEKIKKGDTIYGLNYNKNANRPQINSNLLTGNKTSKQLNIAENMTESEYAALSSKNEHEIYFLQENASIVTETEDGFTITWEAYSDPAYVATLSYTPSDQDVTEITSVTCDTDTIEIVTFSLAPHGDVSVTIGCADPSEVPEAVEFTFTFIQPAGSTRIMKNGVQFGSRFDVLEYTEHTAEGETSYSLSHPITDYDVIMVQIFFNGGYGNSWCGANSFPVEALMTSRTGYENGFWVNGGNNDRAMQLQLVDESHYKIVAAGTNNTLCGIYGIKY